jgi:hypothetical protein
MSTASILFRLCSSTVSDGSPTERRCLLTLDCPRRTHLELDVRPMKLHGMYSFIYSPEACPGFHFARSHSKTRPAPTTQIFEALLDISGSSGSRFFGRFMLDIPAKQRSCYASRWTAGVLDLLSLQSLLSIRTRFFL